MLNPVRKPGLKIWLLAESVGYKPELRHISPLPFLFIAKNRLGYPLVPGTYKLAARNGFVFRKSDCDRRTKTISRLWRMMVFSFIRLLNACSG